jgi:hypothetical protein
MSRMNIQQAPKSTDQIIDEIAMKAARQADGQIAGHQAAIAGNPDPADRARHAEGAADSMFWRKLMLTIADKYHDAVYAQAEKNSKSG